MQQLSCAEAAAAGVGAPRRLHPSEEPRLGGVPLGRSAFLLLAVALLVALASSFTLNSPAFPWKIGSLAIGVTLAVVNLRWAICAVVFFSPLLPVCAQLLSLDGVSFAEHLLIPGLVLGAAVQLARGLRRQPTAIDRWLWTFLAVAGFSALRALIDYFFSVPSPWLLLGTGVIHHFSFSIFDVGRGAFLVVHSAVVFAEGGLWFILLTSPVAGVHSDDLRRSLIASAVFVSLAGVAQGIWLFGMPGYFLKAQPFLLRLSATLQDPNTLGAFLVLVFPIGFAGALETRRPRTAAIGWTVLLGYCLLRSVSRSAWAGIAFAAMVAAVIVAREAPAFGVDLSAAAARRLRRLPLALALLGAASVAVVTLADLAGSVGYRGAHSSWEIALLSLDWKRPVSELIPSRPIHWRAAIEIWRDFPVLGAGLGKYPLLKNRYLPDDAGHWASFTDAHNYYFKVLSELGIVGVGCFVALLTCILRQPTLTRSTQEVVDNRRRTAAALGLTAFLFCSLAQDPLALREIQYVFWAVVALVVSDRPRALSSPTRTGGRSDVADFPEPKSGR